MEKLRGEPKSYIFPVESKSQKQRDRKRFKGRIMDANYLQARRRLY